MASGPITSWEIDGETAETVTDFILGGSKITADGDCSHEIKRRLLLGRKVMTNLDSYIKTKTDCGISTMRKASPNLRHRQARAWNKGLNRDSRLQTFPLW